MALQNLIIKKGLWEDFQKLATKDENTIYFIIDKGRIYVGNTEFSRPTECVSNLSFTTNDETTLSAINKQSD